MGNTSDENISLKRCKIELKQVKSALTKFNTFIDKYSSDQIIQLETRLTRVEPLLEQFNTLESTIQSIEDDFDCDESFEDKYYELLERAKKLILESNQQSEPQSVNGHPVDQISSIQSSNIRFPTLELPKFYGDYEKFGQFRDMFTSLVHNDLHMDNVKKFYYLLSCLRGDASKTLESIEVTNDNYLMAWDMLKTRYENKYITIKNHIKAIIDSPKVSVDYSLRKLTDDLLKHTRSLKVLGEPVESWNTLLIFLIIRKLNPTMEREWEEILLNKKILTPTLDELIAFLSERCKLIEIIECRDPETIKTSLKPNKQLHKKLVYQKNLSHTATQKSNYICFFCKAPHPIYACDQLKTLSVPLRLVEINRLNLYKNCLRNNYTTNSCKSQGCKICQQRHNTLLHPDITAETTFHHDKGEHSRSNSDTGLVSSHCRNQNQVLLSTALIYILSKSSHWIPARALIDNGSMPNFVTRKLAEKLNIPHKKTEVPITGMGKTETHIKDNITATIKSADNNFNATITFLVLDTITEHLPLFTFDSNHLNVPKNIVLADPKFNQSGEIDLLLGTSIFVDILQAGKISLGDNLPTLVSTSLGWIVSGPLPKLNKNQTKPVSCNLSIHDIESQIERFWRIENCSFRNRTLEEQEYLPIRKDSLPLGDSFQTAQKRLYSMERRFRRDTIFKQRYLAFMDEYERLNHMTKIQPSDIGNKPCFYLPHHGVIKETSTTTNLRVVFDGSSKSSNGICLNELLKIGPTIQSDLLTILMRFRMHNYVITSDVEKMYRQVYINESQRDYQRILWRSDASKEIEHFRLNTVTYGTAAASYLAIRSLQQVAHELQDRYPEAAAVIAVILEDFYVDDLLSGSHTIESTLKLKGDLSYMLEQYGFKLRKWMSNHPSILGTAEVDKNANYEITENSTVNTLGLRWNANSDELKFSYNPEVVSNSNHITKRKILSSISRIFDPLGMLSPITITAKIMMQKLWLSKVDWDSPLPSHLADSWRTYISQLHLINNFHVPRRVRVNNPVTTELHGFCDASESAYGACIYIKSTSAEGLILSRLCCSKTRVAPIKALSLPRLELCGALLLSQLLVKFRDSCKIKIDKIFLWSDSTIVLSWISATPNNWKTFVANRVGEIQTNTEIEFWNHVGTVDNPADIVSRGLQPNQLIDNQLWWQGPNWLSKNQTYPISNSPIVKEAPEKRKPKVSLVNVYGDISIFDRSSCLYRLLRIISICRKFIYMASKRVPRGSVGLTPSDVEGSLIALIRLAKIQSFNSEMQAIKGSTPVSRRSTILSLDPFLDSDNLLRVGGRLSKSNLSYDTKHQIILSPKHPLTTLIIRSEHMKHLHAGCQTLLGILRQRFWIPNASTKAVHLEAVGDLSTSSFLNTLKRFVSRRGLPKVVYSDNGTNFVGASNELKTIYKTLAGFTNDGEFKSYLLKNLIEWRFTPAHSPHHGGLWEAAIKRAKYHLSRIISATNSKLTFEELTTVFAQIESILNSRPLTPLTHNSDDLEPLTPGHFLIGDSLLALPQTDITDIPQNRLNQYKMIQQALQYLWKRWSREYLLHLQQRNKWHSTKTNIALGMMVILINENAPPNSWKLGRIIELHPGGDNIVRVVSVKTSTGVTRRAVQRLCPLPME